MFSIALYQPEIPPNTGNIMRLCANMGATLHLIHPMGFTVDDKQCRRAGLDYRESANVVQHVDFDNFLATVQPQRLLACTTKGKQSHVECQYQSGDVLLFGPETRGLPESVLVELPENQLLRIPMVPESRSLNLSNAVAVIAYEAWRQFDFCGAL